MSKFITYLIAKGFLSCRQQGNKKLIKIIIKNNPFLIKDFLKRRLRFIGL